MSKQLFSKDVFIVLLAGGRGVRFWPLSQEHHPKQFLKIFGNDSLLVSTFKRIKDIVSRNNIYILTNKSQSSLLKRQLKGLKFPNKNILLEPSVKNTAPAIGLAALEIKKRSPNAVMVVLPCDHLIMDTKHFYRDLIKAVREAKKEKIVIFGIKPDSSETGYGYIKSGRGLKIDKFIEKPNTKLAAQYIKSKKYFWNSGIFICKADKLLNEIKLYKPALFRALLQRRWNKIQPVSVDVAILERSKSVSMISAHFKWNDLGNWKVWSKLMKKNKSGNFFKGDCKDLGSKNISVLNEGQRVLTLGLKDLIIVNTKNGILVSHKDKTQSIKRLVGR